MTLTELVDADAEGSGNLINRCPGGGGGQKKWPVEQKPRHVMRSEVGSAHVFQKLVAAEVSKLFFLNVCI